MLSLCSDDDHVPDPQNGFYEAKQLLTGNIDFVKIILASGLLMSAGMISPVKTLVIVPLQQEVWTDRMSEYSAYVMAATNVVAIVFSGPFGRLSDHMDRRLAVALVGILCFLPTWMLLPLLMAGDRAAALYVNSGFSILSGVACMSATGSPIMFAFFDDILPPEDRDLAFGVAFAANIIIILTVNLTGFLIASQAGNPELAVGIYITVLTVVFFLAIGSVRKPAQTWRANQGSPGHAGAPSAALYSPGNGYATIDTTTDQKDTTTASILEPLRLAWGYAPLWNLCMVFALVSIPETASIDVNNQYVLSALGVSEAEEHTAAQVRLVSALISYPAQLMLVPLFFITGLVMQRIGPLELVRSLIVPLAFVQVLPVLFGLAPSFAVVPFEGMCLFATFVIFPPLQSLCANIAPTGRVGETMGAVGACKQVSALVGNVIAAILSPILLRSSIPTPLCLMFPLCGGICLAAWPFAQRIEVPERK
eukprot:TRINITY_DN12092_c0_g1_i2.p1 TRINITY_DN12092_c0_g1~~TRINITY_DN12092_c0_g1_i2.p1  ORF type:complete len:479 (-),score=56.77 TRINITY_DN12092_c0_g1_i2:50-1486(-)